MSCNCGSNVSQLTDKKEIKKKQPFDSCLECTAKHLSYAMIVFYSDKDSCLTNIFLAYKHTEKRYKELSEKIFAMYRKDLQFETLRTFIRDLIKNIKKYNESQQETILNLELNLTEKQQEWLYIHSAFQLYYHQQGYVTINQPYIMGYLVQATNLQPDEAKKEKIREVRKQVQNLIFNTEKWKEILMFTDDSEK